jgi:hypothetical protein
MATAVPGFQVTRARCGKIVSDAQEEGDPDELEDAGRPTDFASKMVEKNGFYIVITGESWTLRQKNF